MLRAPVNLTMAAPAAALHLAASGARRVGAERVANVLGRGRLLLSTSVSDRVEWLVCTDLLELPCQTGDRVSTRDALAETILTDPLVLTALRAMLTFHRPQGDIRSATRRSSAPWRNTPSRVARRPRSPPL